jgi:flagellar biosynthesis protein
MGPRPDADSASADRSRAAALRYGRGVDPAPVLVARGGGETARRIVELAKLHRIPVRRDPDLLALLGSLELGDEIPIEAYRAVAELLAFLYRANSG